MIDIIPVKKSEQYKINDECPDFSYQQLELRLRIFVLIFKFNQLSICKFKKRKYFCSPEYCPYL